VHPVIHRLNKIYVSDIDFWTDTRIEGSKLLIHAKDLIKRLMNDPEIGPYANDIKLDIAHPGESVRIIPVKDVIEPRLSMIPGYQCFPGVFYKWNPDEKTVPSGEIFALSGAVVTTVGPIVAYQEGLIDMSGPGADYTVFSKKIHLVLDIAVKEEITPHEHEKTVRMAGLKTADYLAKTAITPETGWGSCENFENPLPKINDACPKKCHSCSCQSIPKIAYLYMLQSQGLLHDTYYCGIDAKTMLPRLMTPSEIMFGALISGNCVSACDKNTTYHHQNNPIIYELLRRHHIDWEFVGCVLTNENVTREDKEKNSTLAAELIASLKPDGVIISPEGFGNPAVDLMKCCAKIEEKGIKTVLLIDEFPGQDGTSPSLVFTHSSANAVVSTGNANEIVNLPPMAKIIGDCSVLQRLAGGSDKSLLPDGSIEVEIQVITGATNQMGFGKLSAEVR